MEAEKLVAETPQIGSPPITTDPHVALNEALTAFEELCASTEPKLLRERLRRGLARGFESMAKDWLSTILPLLPP
jgi:hypothetical protein